MVHRQSKRLETKYRIKKKRCCSSIESGPNNAVPFVWFVFCRQLATVAVPVFDSLHRSHGFCLLDGGHLGLVFLPDNPYIIPRHLKLIITFMQMCFYQPGWVYISTSCSAQSYYICMCWVFVNTLHASFTWPERYGSDALHDQHHSLTYITTSAPAGQTLASSRQPRRRRRR